MDGPYFIIDCVYPRSELNPITSLSKTAKLTFRFKHPLVTSCHLLGECGFILKTVPSAGALWNMRLCAEREDYLHESVHFHDEIRAERMHVYFVRHRACINGHDRL